MRTARRLVLSLLSASAVCAGAGGAGIERWLTYTGAWFKIDYPQDLLIEPVSRSSTSSNGFDGAKFGSKKDGLEFYVYSPQWSGLESDYLSEITIHPTTETLELDSTSAKDYIVAGKIVQTNAIVTRLIRIAAKDGSYRRDYEVTVDHIQSSRVVFGFRYRDRGTYERLKPAYERFKQSLVRYAD